MKNPFFSHEIKNRQRKTGVGLFLALMVVSSAFATPIPQNLGNGLREIVQRQQASAKAGNTATSAPSAAALEPIAFLTVHKWDAKLSDSPEGKKKKIHAQFTWTQNHQAIRISNELVTDGKATPYIDGLYAWDPQQRIIVFWYVDAKGGLTKGTVKMEEGKLVHEFQETEADGRTADYVARVTPHGNEAWDNEIFARNGNDRASLVKVRYEVAQ